MISNSSVLEWLSYSSKEFGTFETINDQISAVGTYLFSDDRDSTQKLTINEITDELSKSVGYILDEKTSLDIIAEALLIYSVSDQSPEKGFFLRLILSLPQMIQIDLMEAIKDGLFRHNLDCFPEDEDEISQDDIPSEICNNSSNIIENEPIKPTDTICLLCLEKDKSIQKSENELQEAIKYYSDIEQRLRAEMAQQSNKLVDTELLLLDKDEQISTYKATISDYKKKIEESDNSKNDLCLEEIKSLRDEVDILRPKAEKFETCQAQLERLREKFDELIDIKQQLKAESNAHSETFSRLVAVEQELELLQKSKSQLEEYKIQYAEANIQIDELTLRVDQKDQQLKMLLEKNQELSGFQKSQLLQSKSLAEELKHASEQLREIERVGGVGDSMSELNPALMQELEKLKSEKASLLAKLDASSLESLDKLEKELSDEKAKSASLQIKWMNTKDSLASALNTIANLSALQNQLIESLEMNNAERDTIKFQNFCNIQSLTENNAKELLNLKNEHQIQINNYDSKLKITEDNLMVKTEEIETQLNENANLVSQLNKTNNELVEKKSMYDNYVSETNETIKELKRKYEEDVTSMKVIEQENILKLKNEHEKLFNLEINRTQSVQSDLEEERLKRRRIEREKKFFEAESHRYKSQLQVSGGGGSNSTGDINSALREMKAMQQQLDEARAELNELKGNSSNKTKNSNEINGQNSGSNSASTGPVRIKQGPERQDKSAGFYGGFIDQGDIIDKRVEQLTREKRELIAKNLEENKEKMELSQKLLLSEKEVSSLKSKVTKLTLEKERVERKMAIIQEGSVKINLENIKNV